MSVLITSALFTLANFAGLAGEIVVLQLLRVQTRAPFESNSVLPALELGRRSPVPGWMLTDDESDARKHKSRRQSVERWRARPTSAANPAAT